MNKDIIQEMIKKFTGRATALQSLLTEVEELRKNTLYSALCKQIIGRILSAESNCEPPTDIDLRLASIIYDRDAYKTQLKAIKQIIIEDVPHRYQERLKGYLKGEKE